MKKLIEKLNRKWVRVVFFVFLFLAVLGNFYGLVSLKNSGDAALAIRPPFIPSDPNCKMYYFADMYYPIDGNPGVVAHPLFEVCPEPKKQNLLDIPAQTSPQLVPPPGNPANAGPETFREAPGAPGSQVANPPVNTSDNSFDLKK